VDIINRAKLLMVDGNRCLKGRKDYGNFNVSGDESTRDPSACTLPAVDKQD
jgi:hypothetical protein